MSRAHLIGPSIQVMETLRRKGKLIHFSSKVLDAPGILMGRLGVNRSALPPSELRNSPAIPPEPLFLFFWERGTRHRLRLKDSRYRLASQPHGTLGYCADVPSVHSL